MHSKKTKTAKLFRMVMPKHICPFGVKAKYLLEKNGYEVEDNLLKNREQTDDFKKKHNVETTPQTFINGKRIGGYDDLREFFGHKIKKNGKSYKPVIALFVVALLLAGAFNTLIEWRFGYWIIIQHFIAVSMTLLSLQKLKDIESFSTMFLNYDLLAKKYVPYGYFYPYLELLAGTLMLGGILPQVSIPVALFIGSIGAISVFKAVYLEKRELKCACMGGGSNVPLGFISLSENLMMAGMACWMLVSYFI